MDASKVRWSWLNDTQLGFYLQIRRVRRASSPDLAMRHLLVIIQHSRLVRRNAPVSTFPLVRKDERNGWNEAVAEWQRRRDSRARVRVSAERALILRRVGAELQLVLSVKETFVSRDATTAQFVPQKTESAARITESNLSQALAMMPELSPADIGAGLRSLVKRTDAGHVDRYSQDARPAERVTRIGSAQAAIPPPPPRKAAAADDAAVIDPRELDAAVEAELAQRA